MCHNKCVSIKQVNMCSYVKLPNLLEHVHSTLVITRFFSHITQLDGYIIYSKSQWHNSHGHTSVMRTYFFPHVIQLDMHNFLKQSMIYNKNGPK